MGINWDIVQYQARKKAMDYVAQNPKHSAEAAYQQGYLDCSGERESLRVINEQLLKKLEALPPGPIIATVEYYKCGDIPAGTSVLGDLI